MPEPTSTCAAGVTYAAAGMCVPMLSAFGVPLGLRADVLIAGFCGSLVAIILLNSVPATGDTWQHLIRTTAKRIFVALASSITAGYLTPMALLIWSLPDSMFLGAAFGVGGGAQRVLLMLMSRLDAAAARAGEGTP